MVTVRFLTNRIQGSHAGSQWWFRAFFHVRPQTQIWKPDTWFSDYNLLTFLCAHDLAPIGKGIKVPCPRSNLEKWAPAIQVRGKVKIVAEALR